jgi:hypothetical protein
MSDAALIDKTWAAAKRYHLRILRDARDRHKAAGRLIQARAIDSVLRKMVREG